LAYLQIKHRCPHCSELSDFNISQLHEVRTVLNEINSPPIWDLMTDLKTNQTIRSKTQSGREGCGISRCPRCYNPVMFIVVMGDAFMKNFLHHMDNKDTYNRHTISEKDIVVRKTYPEMKSYNSHESWPEKLRKPFIDTQMMFDEGKSSAIIISACRSVLDVLTKEAGGKGDNIYGRIEDLAKQGKITNSLKDWSHIVRKLGADATHDLDGKSDSEVSEILNFIKLLLHVLFELPDTIKSQKILDNI
jgi:hypothetical protein